MSPTVQALAVTIGITVASIALGYWLGWRHGYKKAKSESGTLEE